ncbi:hypothetical protein M9H77_20990 [Catharanthus roseus]|uniref:Uncharacterized protein n=1 Tax=Catharanthus roseus TaxID=4058 RepID=A0ACC0ANT5_CATRO|nr:hypothetical protein M9H77_20990 [Catharanthus roseus]
MKRYFEPPRVLIDAGATRSVGSLHFIKHILVPSVVVRYQLMARTPMGVSKITEYIANYGFLAKILAPDLHSGLKFGENQVNGRVSGLHCTWLVLRTRASFDNVDGFFTLRVDPLEEGRNSWRARPNHYLRGHHIMLCSGTAALGRARRGLKLRLVSGQSW